ncbi:MAG: hypothetical protein K6T65_07030 [Peptococcaceae bacterium]|nr:hypothetical protein [Peptococcaceae bacterium]
MTTKCWPCGNGLAVIYSEEGKVWTAARKMGLRLAGEYFRRDGVLFARQFIGEREKVAALVQLAESLGNGYHQLTLF